MKYILLLTLSAAALLLGNAGCQKEMDSELDDRAGDQIPDAVSLASRFVCIQNVERDILNTPIPEHAFFVLCGHDHAVDGEALAAALQKSPKYIGMLASRQKIQSLFSQLRQRGFTDEQLSFVHTPIGLDLGGETPQELAVGILAQLLLVKNGKESRG